MKSENLETWKDYTKKSYELRVISYEFEIGNLRICLPAGRSGIYEFRTRNWVYDLQNKLELPGGGEELGVELVVVNVGLGAGVGDRELGATAGSGVGTGAGQFALVFLRSEIEVGLSETTFVLSDVGGIIDFYFNFGSESGVFGYLPPEIFNPGNKIKRRGFVLSVVATTHGTNIGLGNTTLLLVGNPPSGGLTGLTTAHGG